MYLLAPLPPFLQRQNYITARLHTMLLKIPCFYHTCYLPTAGILICAPLLRMLRHTLPSNHTHLLPMLPLRLLLTLHRRRSKIFIGGLNWDTTDGTCSFNIPLFYFTNRCIRVSFIIDQRVSEIISRSLAR